MFSLCRLCAHCTDAMELTNPVSHLETKLAFCCGWKLSENEEKMPQNACDLCVDQLQKSCDFVERIWAAEKQFNKFLGEDALLSSNECASSYDEIKTEMETHQENGTFQLENEKVHLDDVGGDSDHSVDYNDVFGEPVHCSDAEDSHSSENVPEASDTKMTDKKLIKSEPFLAALAAEDCYAGGIISSNGIAKLEKLFPDMKTMSWNDCQYKCDKCNRIFNGQNNLYAHIRSMHIEEVMSIKLSCFYCNSKHRREYALNNHIASEHFIHLKFRCTHCPDYFWNPRELRKHRNMHTDVEYKCEVCDQTCTNKDVLYAHCLAHVRKKQKDASIDKEQFTCDICSKHFKTKAGVRSHMLLHTDVFDYVCDQCGWRFQSKGNLKGHLASTHTTERPFKCDQCNRRFKTKHQMKNHSVIHNGDFKHVCSECGRKFRRPYTLNVHMRSHNKECPYTCRYCGKSFRHNITLQTHERAHTNDKPYACTQCEYRSTSKGNLNKHMMRAHSIDFRNHIN